MECLEEDITLYARAQYRRCGSFAARLAVHRADDLRLMGDSCGEDVWLRVAQEVERLDQRRAVAAEAE